MTERESIQRELQDILYRHASLGFAVAVSEDDFERWFGKSKNFLPNAFGLCCYVCLVAVHSWIEDNGYDVNDAKFYFEAGNKHEKEAIVLLDRVFDSENVSPRFFVTKEIGGGPIQAADMLAWLNNNFIKRQKTEMKRPRADLQAIIDNVFCISSILDRRLVVNIIAKGMNLPLPEGIAITGTFGGKQFLT